MRTSDATVLRRIQEESVHQDCLPVRNLGVDDWAWRKGQEYGTIMVNLDLHRVVDLLPDRAAQSFSEWLKQHPEIATISRDRCGLYAEGATIGAPQCQQIADRFHLVLNLSATMERVLEERSASSSCLRLRMHPRSPSCRLRIQEAMLEPRCRERHRHNCAGSADWTVTSRLSACATLASRSSDRPRLGHGKEDDPTLASRREVSRAETASPQAA